LISSLAVGIRTGASVPGDERSPTRSSLARVLLIALATAVVAGCAEEKEEASSPTVPRGTPLEIESEPRLTVGVVDGDSVEVFDRVRTPFRTSDGNLAVPATGSNAIQIFRSDGSFVKSLGRPGEGPGEFVGLRAAWPRGDTIEAWDGRAQRLARFLPDGEVEVVHVHEAGARFDDGLGPLGEGWALVGLEFDFVEWSHRRDRASVHQISRDGTHEGRIVGTEGMARHRVPGMTGPHPLTPTFVFDLHEGEVFSGESLTPRIQVRDSSGALLREIALDLSPPGAPSRTLGQVIDSALARAPEERRGALRRRLVAFPEPERLPLFWSFLVDEEGFLWVRPYEPFRHSVALDGHLAGRGGPGGEWRIVAPDGSEVGRIEVPEGFEPWQVAADAVVGIHEDDLGVESVRVHRLRRR